MGGARTPPGQIEFPFCDGKFIFTAVLERVGVSLGGRDGRGSCVAVDAVLFAAAIRVAGRRAGRRGRRDSFLRSNRSFFEKDFLARSRDLGVLLCHPHPYWYKQKAEKYKKKTIKHGIAMKYICRQYSSSQLEHKHP